MDNLRIIATHLLILILGCIFFALIVSSHKRCAEMKELRSRLDTIVVMDTIRVSVPVVRDSMVIRYVRVHVPVIRDSLCVDSVLVRDTALVELPITQKRYTDSTYTAWVSGYSPSLDSIYVYPKREIITTTIRPKPKRWGVGVHGGVGITPMGVQPYIGLGISYNILTF